MFKDLFPDGHPYQWLPIGSMEDLEAASLEDVQNWFRTYYGPDNAVIVIAGDIDAATAYSKVQQYFGSIPAGPPLAKPQRWIPKRSGTQRAVMQDRVPQARIYKVWNVPEGGSLDTDYLEMVGDLLAGMAIIGTLTMATTWLAWLLSRWLEAPRPLAAEVLVPSLSGARYTLAWLLEQQGRSDRALAAYSFGFPILMIVTSVAIGLGAGTSSVVARAIGSDNDRRARRLVTDSIILSFLITGSVSFVGILTIDPLFRLLGAQERYLDLCLQYIHVIFCGSGMTLFVFMFNGILNAQGDTHSYRDYLIIATVANIILDPWFMYGGLGVPAMGVRGIAVATVLVQVHLASCPSSQ